MPTHFDTSQELILYPFMSGVRLVAPEKIRNPERYRRLADTFAMPCNVYLMNACSEMLNLNQTCAENNGFDTPSTLLGCSVFDLSISREDAMKTISEDRNVLYSRKMIINSMTVNVNEENFNYLSFKLPILGNDAKVLGILGYSILVGIQPLDQILTSIYDIGLMSIPVPQMLSPAEQYKNIGDIQLTGRQSEILYYIVRGHNSPQIAARLSLSCRTVEHHIENIRHKFNAIDKNQLIQIIHAYQE